MNFINAFESVNEYYLKAYVDHCIQAIDTGLYSYIAHPDLVYYDKDSKLYQEEMSRLCAYAKEKDMPLEFNLLGFMSSDIIQIMLFGKLQVTIKIKQSLALIVQVIIKRC